MGSCDNLQFLTCSERVLVASSCIEFLSIRIYGMDRLAGLKLLLLSWSSPCANVSAAVVAPSAPCRVLFVNCTLPLKRGEVFFQNETYNKPWIIPTSFSLLPRSSEYPGIQLSLLELSGS